MSIKTDVRNPLKTARGLGSAKNGTHHFILQRISAVVLAVLTPWLVWLLITLIPADYIVVRQTLAQPLNGVLLLSFLVALFWHSRMGLQVVIDDYVHSPGACVIAQILALFACSLGGLIALFAIGRILFAV